MELQAVEAEDFGKAEEVYQLQRLAEDSVMCRRFGVQRIFGVQVVPPAALTAEHVQIGGSMW